MQYLVLMRRKSETYSDEQFSERVGEEVTRLRELYAAGLLRQVWHRSDVAGACLLLEVASEDEARRTVSSLPFVKLDMLEVVAAVPLQPYGGFS